MSTHELDKTTPIKLGALKDWPLSAAARTADESKKIGRKEFKEKSLAMFQGGNIVSQVNKYEDKTINELCERLNELTVKDNLSQSEQTELFYIFVECGNRGSDAKKAFICIVNYFIKKPDEENSAKQKLRAKACWALSKIASSYVEYLSNDDDNKKFHSNALNTIGSVIKAFNMILNNDKESAYIKKEVLKALEEVTFSPVYGTNMSLISASIDLQSDSKIKEQANALIFNIIQSFKSALTINDNDSDNDIEANKTAIYALGKLGSFGIMINKVNSEKEEAIDTAKEMANILTLWPNLDGISSDEDYQKRHRIIVSSLAKKLNKDNSGKIQSSMEYALLEIGPAGVPKLADAIRYNEYIKIKETAVNVLGAMSSHKYADCIRDEALKSLISAVICERNNYPGINERAAKSISMWGKKAEDVVAAADTKGNPVTVYDELKIVFLNTDDIELIYEIGLAMCEINPQRTAHLFKYVLSLPVKGQKDANKKSRLIKNRRVAVFLLGKLKDKTKTEYKLIMSLLEDDDYFLRLKAIEALGSIGGYLDAAQKKEVVDKLTNLCAKTEKQNRSLLINKKEKEKNKKTIEEIDKALKLILRGGKTEEKPVIKPW